MKPIAFQPQSALAGAAALGTNPEDKCPAAVSVF